MTRASWRAAPVLGAALLLALAGCSGRSGAGGAAPGAAANCSGSGAGKSGADTVKIVSSLPMTGSSLGQTQTIVNAICMAVEERGNKVGNFNVVYEPLDDATPAKGSWDAGKEAENANRAV